MMNWFGKNRFGWKVAAFALLIVSAPVCSAHAEPDITTGLVGHWKLDETAGTTAIDIGSGGNDGVMQGGLTGADSVGGRVGSALSFDGIGDDISAGNVLDFADTDSFSISVWYKANFIIPAGLQTLVSKFDTTSPFPGYSLEVSTDVIPTFEFGLVNDGGGPQQFLKVGIPRPADNEWHHVVVTYDGSSAAAGVEGYVDGQQQTLTVIRDTLSASITNSASLTIGSRNSGTRFFDGIIDDTRIYNRPLTPEDIAYLYQSYDGNIKYDEDARVPKFFDGEGWQRMGAGKYIPNAVGFDGTNDYLTSDGLLTGVTDSNKWTGSFWIKSDSSVGSNVEILDTDQSTGGDITINVHGNNGSGGPDDIRVGAENSAGTSVLSMWAEDLAMEDGQWHHVMFSVDLSDNAKRHVVFDGVVLPEGVGAFQANFSTYNNAETIDFTPVGAVGFSVGASSSTANAVNGSVSDFWIDFGTYIDLSVVENRRKFIDANGNPVDLGADGSRPLKTPPDIFLSGKTEDWHINKGTGGGFTENGALTDAVTKPNGAYLPTDGLVGYWKLDEISGSSVIDYASGNNGTYTDSTGSAAAVNSVSGVYGGGLDFTDHKVALGQTSDLDFSGTNAFTISAWVKPTASDVGEHIFHRGAGIVTNGSYIFTRYHLDNTRWRAVIQDGSTFVSTIAPVDSVTSGEWALLTTTWNGTDLAIYENGVQIATSSNVAFTSLADNPTPAYQNTAIGGAGNAAYDYFNGPIDDVAVYNRALTPTEISNMYASGICANPARINGTTIYNADNNVMQYCDGESWNAIGNPIGSGTGGCTNPTRAEGAMIFNKDFGSMQYCDGDDWISVGAYDDCVTGAAVGTACADGSLYAGASPDGGAPMYITSVAYESTMVWDSGAGTLTGITDTTTGETNTASLVGLGSNYVAATYCSNLTAHEKSDWYLPAENEINLVWNTGAPIGGVIEDGSFYWTSTEFDTTRARAINFAFGAFTQTAKANPLYVRCVRKD